MNNATILNMDKDPTIPDDAIEQLLDLAQELSVNKPHLGPWMLLFAAAAVASNRTTFLDAAARVYDKLHKGLPE